MEKFPAKIPNFLPPKSKRGRRNEKPAFWDQPREREPRVKFAGRLAAFAPLRPPLVGPLERERESDEKEDSAEVGQFGRDMNTLPEPSEGAQKERARKT